MFRLGLGSTSAGIALALGLLAGPGRAGAAFTTGIIVGQTILMKTGDPQFELDFRSSLAGMNALETGDFIRFDNLPDYASASFTSPSFGNSLFAVTTSAGSVAHTTDVTFTYKPSLTISNTGTSQASLGDFLIATTDNYDPSNIPPQLLVSFTYMTRTTSTIPPYPKIFGTGQTPAATLVPEPASAFLVAIGLSAGAVLARKSRRRPA